MLFPVLLLCNLLEVNSLALKVSSYLPKNISSCFLGEYKVNATETSIGCVALCKLTPLCLLACRIGYKCYLYDANISTNWNNLTNSDPILAKAKCHSLWAELKDLAPKAKFYAPSEHQGTSKAGAHDGFACKNYAGSLLGVEGGTPKKSWVNIEFTSPQVIERVVVQVYGQMISFFEQVEVRLGNFNGSGNFSQNALFGYYQGPAPLGEIVTFTGNNILQGKYISLQAMGITGIGILEIKIIYH